MMSCDPKHIHIEFKKQLPDILFDINLAIPSKGITAIFGRSGAGKTTVINAISGLITPDCGLITLGDKVLFQKSDKDATPTTNLAIEKRNVGYVFQDARLFPHYKVRSNLLYGVKQQDNDYFDRIINLLSLGDLLERYPSALSGGEKQRVAIGRALLSKPDILLMDEPLASLDLPRKREVMPFLEKLALEVNTPIIYVTHSLNEILRLANHLVIINQGKIELSGSIEAVWGSKAMRPWQSFSEQSSLFAGVIAEHHPRYALTRVQLAKDCDLWVQGVNGATGSLVRLQVRANDVSITLDKPVNTSIRNILPAVIQQIKQQKASDDKQSVGIRVCLQATPSKEAEANVLPSLWVTVTQWACDELDLAVGQAVYVQIKGVSVTQKDITLLVD